MNRRIKSYRKESRIKSLIYSHIENNIKEYFIVGILFLIGVIIGVIFINNTGETQKVEINQYLTSFVSSLKENQSINEGILLKESILKNSGLALLLWFMGSTVIGILIVYLVVAFRGFVLGYTIASAISIFRFRKRSFIYICIIIVTNNIIYTLYISIGCEWNEVI